MDERVGLDFGVREREVARDGRGGAVTRGRDEAVDDAPGCGQCFSLVSAFAASWNGLTLLRVYTGARVGLEGFV